MNRSAKRRQAGGALRNAKRPNCTRSDSKQDHITQRIACYWPPRLWAYTIRPSFVFGILAQIHSTLLCPRDPALQKCMLSKAYPYKTRSHILYASKAYNYKTHHKVCSPKTCNHKTHHNYENPSESNGDTHLIMCRCHGGMRVRPRDGTLTPKKDNTLTLEIRGPC